MNRNIALMALTGILTLAACGQTEVTKTCNTGEQLVNGVCVTTVTPVTTHVMTFAVSGIGTSVPVTVTKADGTIVGSYNVANGQKLELPAGSYIVTPNPVSGYTNNGNQTVNLTSGNATATVTYTAVTAPTVQTGVMTIDLVGMGAAPITIRDASGAVVANYSATPTSDGQKVTLPVGTYTVTAGEVNGYDTPLPVTVNLTTAGQTATLTYVAKPAVVNPNPTGTAAYYVNAAGERVYLNFANGFNRDLFRFNAWLENESGGINPAPINAGTGDAGNAIDDERLEYAPVNHQNIVASYMEYNDNGTWRPVIGGQVEMNILPEAGNAYPSIRFTAADDVNRSTAPVTTLDIHSNAFSSRSWTNASGAYETNPIFYPNDNSYPYYNVTGVSNPVVPGYTWAALMNDPKATQAYTSGTDYMEARVQVVGFVNGNEIAKQWVTKRFIPQAKVEIKKELLAIDPVTRQCTSVLTKDGSTSYLPGAEACFRITVTNTGAAPARNIEFGETWTGTAKPDTYSIGMTPAEYARLTAAGVNFRSTVRQGSEVRFVDEKFSGTIGSLAAGASQTITFFATGVNNGKYCDEATLGNYLNNPDPVTGAYRLVPNYGQTKDQACFSVYGQPDLNITKTITYPDNNPVDGGYTTNRGDWVNVTVTVRNDGTQTAENVLVSDRLNIVSDANTAAHEVLITDPVTGMTRPVAAQGNDGLDFTIPRIEAGGLLTYTYRARANADGTYCDTASITSVGGAAVTNKNSQACFDVRMAQLTIAKTNSPTEGLLPGDYYTSNIVVRNIGSGSAYEVNVFDLAGIGQTSGAQIQFINGRYIITTDEKLPMNGAARGVAGFNSVSGAGDNRTPVGAPISPVVVDPTQAPYATGVDANGNTVFTPITATTPAVVTIPPVLADQIGYGQSAPGTDGRGHGVVIPAGGQLTLTVVSRIPTDAVIDNYCDIAVVTANNANLVSNINRARACTTTKHILAVQTTLDDANDPIAKGASTLFTGSFFNELQSTEGAAENVMTFTVGKGETSSANLTPRNIQVWYDPTAVVDGSGQIVFDPGSVGFTSITSTATISAFDTTTGVFTVKPNVVIPTGGVVFVTYDGVAGATTATGSYNSNVVWTSKGSVSGTVKTDSAAEDTTVR